MNLPKEYIAWLESTDTNKEYIYENIIIDFYSQTELQNKNHLASQFFNEKVFKNNNEAIKAEELESNNTYSFTKERTDKCITIGESNRNYIFVDPFDDFTLWVLILSNKCVFKESGNIYDIIKFSKSYNA